MCLLYYVDEKKEGLGGGGEDNFELKNVQLLREKKKIP